jgi:hypothetical protein
MMSAVNGKQIFLKRDDMPTTSGGKFAPFPSVCAGLTAMAVFLALPAGPAAAETDLYASTIGQTGVTGDDNGHFGFLGGSAVDTVHGRLFIADNGNDRVQIYDSATLGFVGTIGATGVPGSDNSHLNAPMDVGFDAANNHILVADAGNQRIQIFDAASFFYVATIGQLGIAGIDNAHFGLPQSVKINPVAGQIYVADAVNHRVQIFDAHTLGYLATLGTPGVAGSDADHLSEPADAEYDPATNQIMVADLDNARVQFYDAASFRPLSQLGVTATQGIDNAHFNLPVSVGFDPTNNLILVADSGTSNRVQVFSAATYRFITTLGVNAAGIANGHFTEPLGISADPVHSRLFIGDSVNERVQIFTALPTPLAASVLPGTRSVELGATPTVFANILNIGSAALSNCGVSLPASAPAGLTLSYQTTDPATNKVTGTALTPAALAAAPAGGFSAQTFVLSFASAAAITQTGQPLEFACDNVPPATLVPGVNSADLIFSASPVPDVIALAATAQADGVVHVPVGSPGAFAVASVNIGAAANLTVTADTAGAALPLNATVCQTGANGQCLAQPAGSVSLAYAANATPTFSIFVSAAGTIPLAPATSRIFLRFLDADGVSHGATSVAVEAM